MKKIMLQILPLAFVVVLVACGGGSTETTTTTTSGENTEATTEDAAKDSESSDAGSVQPSAEMSDFISGFDGKSETVEAALAKYAANDDIKGNDMGMYNLAEPKITAQDGDCYTLVCKSGMVENTYVVCWTDAKISSIEEKM